MDNKKSKKMAKKVKKISKQSMFHQAEFDDLDSNSDCQRLHFINAELDPNINLHNLILLDNQSTNNLLCNSNFVSQILK